MAMTAKPFPTSQYAAAYRVPASREHHGFFASPTESEFGDHPLDPPNISMSSASNSSFASSVKSWDEMRVSEWLKSISCGQYADIFMTNNINGVVLMELDRDTLRELGVKRVGDQIRIAAQAKAFRSAEYKSKSKASKNREAINQLFTPQFTPPSSASPKSTTHSQRFIHGNREQSKRASRIIPDSTNLSIGLQYPQSAGIKPYSPSKPHHTSSAIRTPASASTDNILTSKYANVPARSQTLPVDQPKKTPPIHIRGPSNDVNSTNSILPIDKNLIRVIYDNGRSCVVNIDGWITVDDIMIKTLRKGSLNEAHFKNYCFYVLDNLEPNPALSRRINDAEVVRICSESSRTERNRLILRKIHQGEPAEDQLKTAASIAAQIQAIQTPALNIAHIPKRSQAKLEKLTGEPLPSNTYPQSPASAMSREQQFWEQQQRANEEPLATPRPRIKEVFGGRPPSNLITQDLSSFFPDYDAEQIDRTVRMSIRRSRRLSRAANRLSMMSNYSVASNLRDAPPVPNLPAIPDAWLGDQATPKGLRPLSVQRLGDRPGGYRDSIASSILQPLDEESPIESTPISATAESPASALGSYYDDKRDSDSQFGNDSGEDIVNKRISQFVAEDSEDDDEELSEYLETASWDNIKYMKGALIGQGSFGSVYLALHAITGELMAVKQVELPGGTDNKLDAKKNTMVEALKHEIGLLRELKHPNIVSYLGSNTEETTLNILLEYVPGGSVAKMLVTYGPLGEYLIANFVRQILKGLAYLHSKEIIHRDIKGANILVDHQGFVKISDFGISKRVEASTLMGTPAAAQKKAGHRVSLQGSVFWMAPEVVKQTAYTRKADIWSLGCLIVEMLTGQRPHPNCTQLQAIFKIGRGSDEARPTVPDGASEHLKAFLEQTFDIEYNRRPAAEELLQSAWLQTSVESK